MPLLPYVRRELFLQAIKNRDASALPDPNNREELFLKAIAEETALIPSGVSVVLPAAVSEMLANLPEAHTHTELFYKDIIDAILIATMVTDTTPYLIRATADNAHVSSPARLTKKLGNTVCVNDLSNPPNASGTLVDVTYSITSRKVTLSGTASATNNLVLTPYNVNGLGLAGHKIYIPPVGGGAKAILLNNVGGRINFTDGGIIDIPNTDTRGYAIRLENGNTINVTNYACHFIDLTLWFGSNDLIPSDLLSHPEDWGRYYSGSLAYDAGHLESADGTVMRSIGRNVWDEEWEYGSISSSTGQNDSSQTTAWRTKNYIPIIPNSAYYITASVSSKNCKARFYDAAKNYIGYQSVDGYNIYTKTAFTVPVNAYFMRLSPSVADVPTPNNNITISLYYSGESGYDEYYPYSVLAEIDTGSEVLRSAGAVADEKTPDGKIWHRVGAINLGSVDWSRVATNTAGYYRFLSTSYVDGAPTPAGTRGNVRTAKYCAITGNEAYNRVTGITLSTNGNIMVYDDALAQESAADFKTAMSGIYLYYEHYNIITEQGTAFDPEYVVENGGTESWTNLKGIPQGHETEYTEYTT